MNTLSDLPDDLTSTLYTSPPPPDLETLPDPGPLPPGSRLPVRRNDLFTGRVEPLKILARALLFPPRVESETTLATQATPRIAAIQGVGGVGKTQLAIEFAYRYGRYFHGVHWLDASLPDTLGSEIAVCGEAMGLPGWPEKQPDQITRTLNEWRRSGPRLVILDNMEDAGAAWEWSVRLGGGPIRLLLSARRSDWPTDLGVELVRLDVFAPEESRAFLRHYLPIRAPHADDEGSVTASPRVTDADLAALAERLGHLPLALELAGRCLVRDPDLGVVAYVKKLEDVWSHPSMQGWWENRHSPIGHDLNLVATFALSWEQVKNEAARRLFLLSGHCAPNRPVPRNLLAQAAGLDVKDCSEALLILAGLGLLKMEDAETRPIIHPVLAEYARAVAKVEEQVELDLLPALANGLAALTQQVIEADLPARFVSLRPHVEVVAAAAQEAGLERAGTLWNNLGYHLHGVGDYVGARAAYERALAIDEAIYGDRAAGVHHPKVGIRVNNLGLVLHDLRDLSGARAAFERALAIGEAVYGPDHPKVATRVNNLGLVLKALGDLAGARAAFERALAIDEAIYGPHHPSVATDVNNLGAVLRALGDLNGARAAYERALAIDEVIYGPHHPSVALRVNNLGLVLCALGDLNGARAAFERALLIDEAIYGDRTTGAYHPNVARDVNNLGGVLQALGDLNGARAAYERALAIDEATYGPDHPSVATRLNNLGAVLQDLGDLNGARTAFGRALRILEQSLPPDHSHVRRVRNNLEGLG